MSITTHTVQTTSTIALDQGLIHYFVQPLRFSALNAIGGIQELSQRPLDNLCNQNINEPAEDLDSQIRMISAIKMLADMLDQYLDNTQDGELKRS
jgi:hypothetical protein